MIIKVSRIKSNTVSGIMTELYDMPDLMEIIRGQNMRGGDAIEAMASDIIATGQDIDTDNYSDIR